MLRLVIITPTLGASPWLAETVASVASFAPGALHVLVAPQDKLAGLLEAFPHVHVVSDPGGGMYSAINAGVAAIEEWDAFSYINDDDLLLPGFAKVREVSRRDSVAYGLVELIDENGLHLGNNPVSRFPVWNGLLYRSNIEAVYQQGTVIGRDAWIKAGDFDAGYSLCGDSDWLARACLRGCPYVFRGTNVAAFRLRKMQMSRNLPAMEEEGARFRAGLGPRPAWWLRLPALLVFRLGNMGVYWKRLIGYGWITSRTLQTKS